MPSRVATIEQRLAGGVEVDQRLAAFWAIGGSLWVVVHGLEPSVNPLLQDEAPISRPQVSPLKAVAERTVKLEDCTTFERTD